MSTHKSVLDEHAQLGVLLRDLRSVCQWNPELLRGRHARSILEKDLRELQLKLRRHFDTEESGSYHEEIRNRRPSAEGILNSLQLEHPVFLDQARSLEVACGNDSLDADDCTQLLRQLATLLDALKLHEEEENALIKSLFVEN